MASFPKKRVPCVALLEVIVWLAAALRVAPSLSERLSASQTQIAPGPAILLSRDACICYFSFLPLYLLSFIITIVITIKL